MFVPTGFDVPRQLDGPGFRLTPLGPEHNAADHRAWTSSIDHIRATPGFAGRSWPPEGGMTLQENFRDLQSHADDFAARTGFTFTVTDPGTGAVIGCVYIYPARDDAHDADVRSWVDAEHAELDGPVRDAVRVWLADRWPFSRVAYDG